MTDPKARLAAALSDRYTLGDEVGVGGMATVYMAQDIKHGRSVALKVLKPELSAAMGTDRFPREIRLVASFNHPHILSLYDSGETDGFLYYVMPFVDGETLGARLAREKELPIGDTIRILIEVTDALAYAHARGVVHRDIKPGNVLLADRHAVVADFGVAKALSTAGGDQLTTVGIAVGTPQYMAPEQAMGEADIDHRVDIYAVGILAYEMLTGRAPFEAKTSQAMLATPSGGRTPTDTRPFQATAVRPKAAKPKWWIGVAAAVGIAVVGGAGWMMAQGSGGAIERIGVMPIEDISGQDELFVTAMHSALTNAVAQLGVGVASRADMARYAGGSKSTREIATEQNLDAIVETNVFRAGDVMRITVQFSDPATTRSLWAATYSTNVTDVLSAQGAVVDSIRIGIGAALGVAGKPRGDE